MKIDPKYWIDFSKSLVGLTVIIGVAGVWAGDQRWMTVSAGEKLVEKLEINTLDRQITFLHIKIDQGEATDSEKIWVKTLEQQLRALKNN